jgi:hypothetical protein
MFDVLQIRIGWYRYRKSLGYPITWRRALFSDMPRFGSFEECEEGCPQWAKRDYTLVAFYETEGQ